MRLVLSLLALVSLAGQAQALSTVYTDRAAWEAAVAGTIYTETFDGDQAVAPLTAGALSTPLLEISIPAKPLYGATIAAGIFTSVARGDGADVFALSAPTSALGVDVLYVEGSLDLPFTIGGATYTYRNPVYPPVPGFFGIVSDEPFSSVSIGFTGYGGRLYRFDNFSVAPEPTELLLSLAAASAVLTARRRPDRSSRRCC